MDLKRNELFHVRCWKCGKTIYFWSDGCRKTVVCKHCGAEN